MKSNLAIKQFLTICLICLLTSAVKAEQVPYIKNTFSVAINSTSYPYHFIDKEGEPAGLMVDIWKLWAKKQQVKVVFVPMNWQQTLEQVEKRQVDIHAGLSRNKQREQRFDFTERFFLHHSHLFLHRSIAHVKHIEQLAPYAIGVVSGSSHEEVLKTQYPLLTIKRFPDRHTLYKAAIAKEVLIIAGLERLSKNFVDYQLLIQNYPIFLRLPYDTNDYSAAVAKNRDPLLTFIHQGMEKITSKEKSAIERQWLGLDKSDNLITLTYSDQQAPFSKMSVTGKGQGFFIDLWRLWAQHNGLKIEFQLDDSKNLNLLTLGIADIHITNVESLDENFGNYLGPVIYSVNYGLFLSNELGTYEHVKRITEQRIGVLKNTAFINDLKANTTNCQIIVYDNYGDMFKAAERGEIDIIAGQKEVIEHRLFESNFQSLFSHFSSYQYIHDVHTVLNHSNAELNSLITEGFADIPIEELVTLERKWHLDKSSGFYQQQLTKLKLTAAELTWLEGHKEIKLGITNNWLPMEFVNTYGEHKGINPDIFTLLSQRIETPFSYSVFDNFEEMYQALLDGEIDAIGSVMITPEREKQVFFTESYWSMPWVIVHPRVLGKELVLENFKGKSLAITKGYYLVSEIREQFPTITLKLVNNHEEGLIAIQKGMVDGFIDNLSSGSELLKRESLLSLGMSVLDDVDRNGNHIAVNKAHPMLAQILNKAVKTISDAESQKIYEKWFDISIETGLDKNVVIRVAAQVSILIFIVIILIMVWNRRLYKEIKKRKRLEKQMKYMATHDDLTGLANRVLLKDRLNTAITFHQRQKLEVGVLFIDLDGFKSINDTHGHDVGDELLIEVATRLKGCVRESDTVVRFGGDEFVLLLKGLNNQSEAAYVADKVLKAIQQPIKLSAVTTHIGCSIGIAMFPRDGQTDNDLLKVADSLMYKVKATGKNHYIFNSP